MGVPFNGEAFISINLLFMEDKKIYYPKIKII